MEKTESCAEGGQAKVVFTEGTGKLLMASFENETFLLNYGSVHLSLDLIWFDPILIEQHRPRGPRATG